MLQNDYKESDVIKIKCVCVNFVLLNFEDDAAEILGVDNSVTPRPSHISEALSVVRYETH